MGELIHKLGIDWKLLIANAVTFLIVLWVLRRYAFTPILKVLDERRALAAKTVADNQAAEEAVAGADAQHKHIIAEARREAGQILVNARGEAEALKEQAVTDAKAAAYKVMLEMKADMKREYATMMTSAKEELADIVVKAAGSLVEEKAGSAFDTKAAKNAVKEVVARS